MWTGTDDCELLGQAECALFCSALICWCSLVYLPFAWCLRVSLLPTQLWRELSAVYSQSLCTCPGFKTKKADFPAENG